MSDYSELIRSLKAAAGGFADIASDLAGAAGDKARDLAGGGRKKAKALAKLAKLTMELQHRARQPQRRLRRGRQALFETADKDRPGRDVRPRVRQGHALPRRDRADGDRACGAARLPEQTPPPRTRTSRRSSSRRGGHRGRNNRGRKVD